MKHADFQLVTYIWMIQCGLYCTLHTLMLQSVFASSIIFGSVIQVNFIPLVQLALLVCIANHDYVVACVGVSLL